MKQFSWKNLLPHIIAVGIFLVVAVIYCKPALEGKVVNQADLSHWKGMAQSSFKYKETHGHFPLWVNSMFGGMPGYQIAMDVDDPVNLGYLHYLFTLFLPQPISFFFLLCTCFYFLSQVMRVNSWIGILGSIAYAYATYDPIIIVVGHVTKVQAMAYMPALLAAILLVFQKKYWIGAAATIVFSFLLIQMNHLQMSYYFAILAFFVAAFYAVYFIKRRDYKHITLSTLTLVSSVVIGILGNIVILATTLDYSKATMRGGTLSIDTTAGKSKQTSGLPIDYAFNWSFLKAESFTMLIPRIFGGSSSGELDGTSHIAKLAEEKGIPEDQAVQIASYMPAYWGGMSKPNETTSGPAYLGAVICFLFILGLVYVKSIDKWWILFASVFFVALSWGRNFSFLNDFLFDYLPLYNKFRAPSQAAVIPQLLFPLLAVLALQKFFFEEKDLSQRFKALKNAGLAVGCVLGVAIVMYFFFTYVGADNDESVKSFLSQITRGNEGEAKSFYNALIQDRKALFAGDLIRSIIFIGLAFGTLWLVVKNKIKARAAIIVLIVSSSIDVLAIGRRYLNDESFQTQEEYDENYFKPSAADLQILKDTGYYRVLNLTTNIFNDAHTSYHHNSVGGYSPAKLGLAEDVLNYQLRKQPMNFRVLNMLNTKYVIQQDQQGQPQVYTNPDAFGSCWLVKGIQYVRDPVSAMKALDSANTRDTAIIEESYQKSIGLSPQPDSSAQILLIDNDNDVATYSFKAKSNQFAVFSDIYYDRGWKAYVDDKEAMIIKTNYALRGLPVPAGTHTIRFEFKPASYYGSLTIQRVASGLSWLVIIIAIWQEYRRKKRNINKAS
ncbi:YfhO family protein [Foetidibacter luteolus]|uniref:YfhO family protein n=1 Tax=Foetidibacter luteolus TaxID=2608880 RepID=UPI00129A7848|nr:YfhO family protein [Foetidibacter luteolus]